MSSETETKYMRLSGKPGPISLQVVINQLSQLTCYRLAHQNYLLPDPLYMRQSTSLLRCYFEFKFFFVSFRLSKCNMLSENKHFYSKLILNNSTMLIYPKRKYINVHGLFWRTHFVVTTENWIYEYHMRRFISKVISQYYKSTDFYKCIANLVIFVMRDSTPSSGNCYTRKNHANKPLQ